MNVKVSAREFPLLGEELARQPKGPRRTNRLAHLATLGLCWERALGAMYPRPGDLSPQLLGQSAIAAPSAGDGMEPYRSRLQANQLAALFDGEEV